MRTSVYFSSNLCSAVCWLILFSGPGFAASPAPVTNALDITLKAAHETFRAGDLTAARAAYRTLGSDASAPAACRGLAYMRMAQMLELAGDLPAAATAYLAAAELAGCPEHLAKDARVQARRVQRIAQGLPAFDPAESRLKLPKVTPSKVTLHVATTGSDLNDGSAEKPLASLEGAKLAIRKLTKSKGLPQRGVTVLVHGGEYVVTNTWTLGQADSGSAVAPIIFRAALGERPIFTGGSMLRGFTPLSDPDLRSRIPASIRGKVVQLKLTGDLLPLELGGFASGRGFKTHPAHELFFNGAAQPLARGPNEGFLRIADVAVKDGTKGYDRVGSKVGQFFYKDDRPSRWVGEPDLLLYGYWFWDWADSYERVATVDAGRRLITLQPPVHNYGFSVGAPFYAVNALSEIDVPGEWYLHRQNKLLIFYPPSDPNEATVQWSAFTRPLVSFDQVSHVRLEGLTWELGSADAIEIRGGTNCLLHRCVVRHFAGNGVEIAGGSGHGLLSCHIHSLGRGGVTISGGDRKTLTPGRHFVENCRIHDLSRIDHTYTPAVLLDGVGHRIAHNELFDVRSSAMRVNGNDHLIEFNDVHDAVLESDDQGGADMFGNPTFRGNVYRHNFWHHIGNWRGVGENPKCGQAGIRLDDAISETLLYGNIFYRCSAGALGFGAVQIHGGKDNVVDNNIFVDCAAAISFSPWPEPRWRDFVKKALADSSIDYDLYLRRYPRIATALENPNRNYISRNLVLGCKEFLRRDSRVNEIVDNSLPADDLKIVPQKIGSTTHTLDLPDYKQIIRYLSFSPIPIDQIGCYPDPRR